MLSPPEGPNWTALSPSRLPLEGVSSWAVDPSAGGVVVFNGTARDHSDGRPGVSRLAFEAYEEQVVPRMDRIVQAIRTRWPDVIKVAIIHRVGEVPLTESAVLVAVSAPHRAAAFEAARYGIDTLKNTIPIWKSEDWDGGSSWGLEPQHIVDDGLGSGAFREP